MDRPNAIVILFKIEILELGNNKKDQAKPGRKIIMIAKNRTIPNKNVITSNNVIYLFLSELFDFRL
jgi:hypothetical protein